MERTRAGLQVRLAHDAEGDQELDEGENGIGGDRLVVDHRAIPGDGVGHPTRVAAGCPVQHATEAVGSAGEHEGLDLEHGVEQPHSGQHQSVGPLEVWWRSVPGGGQWAPISGRNSRLHIGYHHDTPSPSGSGAGLGGAHAGAALGLLRQPVVLTTTGSSRSAIDRIGRLGSVGGHQLAASGGRIKTSPNGWLDHRVGGAIRRAAARGPRRRGTAALTNVGSVPLVAGIDSSTQSTKVQLRDVATGQVIGSGRSAHPATSPPRSEQEPERLVGGTDRRPCPPPWRRQRRRRPGRPT